MKLSNYPDPFVVFGPSKSGTTWLQKLLDSHPDVRCHFQLPMFGLDKNKSLFAKGNGVLNLNKSPFKGVFKTELEGQEYFARLTYFSQIQKDLQGLSAKLKAEKATDVDTIDFWHHNGLKAIFETLLYDNDQKKIFGNKAYTNLETFFRLYPAGKIINIIRDGRDVCVSRRFHTLRMGAYYHGDEKNKWLYHLNSLSLGRRVTKKLNRDLGWFGEKNYRNRDDVPLFSAAALAKFAKDWALITEYILEWQTKRPEQVFCIRYEGLKSNPNSELAKVLQFIGADASPECIHAMIEQNSFSKLKSNKASGSFFRKGIIGDWKNHFTEKDTQLFKQLTGDLLVRLEYEANLEWE